MDQPVCTRKSLSIPKSSQRAPSAGTPDRKAVEKTVYYGGQFGVCQGGKAYLRLNIIRSASSLSCPQSRPGKVVQS